TDVGVRIVDTPAARVHRPADLVGTILSLLGITLVVILAVYAHGTTSGIGDDLQGVARIVRRFVVFPVALLEWIVTVAAPIAVLVELVLRRLLRQALESVVGALMGFAGALLAVWLMNEYAITPLKNE